MTEYRELHKRVDSKVAEIFLEIAGERAQNLSSSATPPDSAGLIQKAFSRALGSANARDLGFHLTDWNDDAAFIIALHLFPERFDVEEVEAGVTNFLVHAPNHIAAASKLAGYPIKDIFEVGALDGEED